MKRNVTQQDTIELFKFVNDKLCVLLIPNEDCYGDWQFIKVKSHDLLRGSYKHGGLMHNYNGLIGVIRMFIEEWRDKAMQETNLNIVEILDLIRFCDEQTRNNSL